jgi:hypothetical protein
VRTDERQRAGLIVDSARRVSHRGVGIEVSILVEVKCRAVRKRPAGRSLCKRDGGVSSAQGSE